MSTDATLWAWKVQGISATQKLILLSLADRANEQHECWPSIKRLQKDTCIKNKDTISNNIKALESMGLLVALRDHGYSNRYRLIGVLGREDSRPNIGTSPNIATSPKFGVGVGPKLGNESKKNLKEKNSLSNACVRVDDVAESEPVKPANGPSLDFVELRARYDEVGRQEGPLDGYAEFLALKKRGELVGNALTVMDAVDEWAASGEWNGDYVGQYAPKLAKFLASGQWQRKPKPKVPVSKARDFGTRATTVAQERALERDKFARELLGEIEGDDEDTSFTIPEGLQFGLPTGTEVRGGTQNVGRRLGK